MVDDPRNFETPMDDAGRRPAAIELDRCESRTQPGRLAAIFFAATSAVVATVVWGVVFLTAPFSIFAAGRLRPDYHDISALAALPLSLPHLVAPALVLIPLGAYFQNRWRQTALTAALVQVLGGLAFVAVASLALPNGARVDFSLVYLSIVAPAVLFPLATWFGSKWMRGCDRDWKFWIEYVLLVVVVCFAVVMCSFAGFAQR